MRGIRKNIRKLEIYGLLETIVGEKGNIRLTVLTNIVDVDNWVTKSIGVTKNRLGHGFDHIEFSVKLEDLL